VDSGHVYIPDHSVPNVWLDEKTCLDTLHWIISCLDTLHCITSCAEQVSCWRQSLNHILETADKPLEQFHNLIYTAFENDWTYSRVWSVLPVVNGCEE
jgi:hypothetical protein